MKKMNKTNSFVKTVVYNDMSSSIDPITTIAYNYGRECMIFSTDDQTEPLLRIWNTKNDSDVLIENGYTLDKGCRWTFAYSRNRPEQIKTVQIGNNCISIQLEEALVNGSKTEKYKRWFFLPYWNTKVNARMVKQAFVFMKTKIRSFRPRIEMLPNNLLVVETK